MVDHAAAHRVIGASYDAVLDPGQWPEAMRLICTSLDCPAASVHAVDPIAGRTLLFADHGSDLHYVALANTTYLAMNPVAAGILLGEVDQPLGLFDMIDEAELVETRWYREWCVPQRYHDMMGALIAKRATEVGSVAAVRLVDQPRFGEAERGFFRLVAPHVRRAVTLAGLLEQRAVERDAFASLMDQLSAAVFLVNAGGIVLHANAAAERLAADGAIVRLRERGLVLSDADADRALRAVLRAGADAPRFVPAQAGADRYLAAVLPIRATGVFAVFLQPQGPDLPSHARALRDLFGLTPRELSVLLPLMEGRDVSEVAELLGIGRETAKTHLDRLFEKTGTNRQADLVQAVLRAVPPVRAG